MTTRYAVRPAVADDGLTLYWLIDDRTGTRVLSSVFRGTVERLADAMNRRQPEAGHRREGGSW